MKEEITTERRLASMYGSPTAPAVPPSLGVLFAVHAALTFAAEVVLIVEPDLIPSAVGIRLDRSAYLICYLLAASELSIAALSWKGRSLTDTKALRVIVIACVVFHSSSGILEIYAFTKGVSAAIWSNIVLRAVVVFLFAYYGLFKMPNDSA